jgi:hypothetical protein
MNPFRKKHVVAAVLEALAMADGYPLAVDVVRSYVRDLVKPPVSDEEWRACVDELAKRELIAHVPSKFDPELEQYTITERGEALRQSQA